MEINQAKLYDRQIQIFGADTQKVISESEVLIAGLDTITSEVAKNLVLTGFNIALHDRRTLTASHIEESPMLGACNATECGQPLDEVVASKLREINPCVSIRVTSEPLADGFTDSTKVFVSGIHDFDDQHAISAKLQQINVPKFYLFQANYRFLAFAELPKMPLKLSDLTREQLHARLAEHNVAYDFSDKHTASLDDFVLRCVFGATLNQSLLGLISHGRGSHNILYLDADANCENPSQQRHLACLLLN